MELVHYYTIAQQKEETTNAGLKGIKVYYLPIE
jgi:hypothetical protein